MKSVLGLVVAMMLVAPGCGDDTTSTTGSDMSVGLDMTTMVTAKDMTMLPATTCAAALGCTQSNCLTLGSEMADEACAENCAKALTGDQASEFTALFTCVVTYARSASDGGSTVFDPTKVIGTITPPAGQCVMPYEACMGVGLDH